MQLKRKMENRDVKIGKSKINMVFTSPYLGEHLTAIIFCSDENGYSWSRRNFSATPYNPCFMATDNKAPSVGWPSKVSFCMMALLQTQPTWKEAEKYF